MGQHSVDSTAYYAAEERALRRALACLDSERSLPKHLTRALERALGDHRDRHRARAALTTAEVLRFSRLHRRMAETVTAQEHLVRRLTGGIASCP